MKKILVVNGPNLNMLGVREPDIYGKTSYADLCKKITEKASSLGVSVELFQSNSEGGIIDKIQESFETVDGIIINPGAYTHYSLAIADCLKSVCVPAIEVHISNIHTREDFRKKSVTAPSCQGQISGLGIKGYLLALEALSDEQA